MDVLGQHINFTELEEFPVALEKLVFALFILPTGRYEITPDIWNAACELAQENGIQLQDSEQINLVLEVRVFISNTIDKCCFDCAACLIIVRDMDDGDQYAISDEGFLVDVPIHEQAQIIGYLWGTNAMCQL